MPFRKEDSRIYTETRDTFKKSVKDLIGQWEGMKENAKRDTGYYSKKAEALARAAANEATARSFRSTCERRIHWLQLILGINKVKVPKDNIRREYSKLSLGIKQVLGKTITKGDKFAFDTSDLDKSVENAQLLKSALEALKGNKNKKYPAITHNKFKDTEAKDLISYSDDLKYSAIKDKLKESIKNIPKNDDPLKELEKEIKNSSDKVAEVKKAKGKSQSVYNDYLKLKQDLEDALSLGEYFVKSFFNQSVSKSGPVSKFESKTNKLTNDQENPTSAPDSAEKDAKGSFMLASNQLKSQMLNYKKITEEVIDTWIYFHRFIEKHKSAEVIDDSAANVILSIRRANRSNFFKEGIDQNGEVLDKLINPMKSLAKDSKKKRGPRKTSESDSSAKSGSSVDGSSASNGLDGLRAIFGG